MTEQHVSEQDYSVEAEETVPSRTAEVDESVEATDESADATPDESAEDPADEATADEDATEEDEAEDEALEVFRRELWAKPGDWFVIHTYSGMENRVKSNLENRIISLNMEDYIHEIVVPTRKSPRSRTASARWSSGPSCPATSWSGWTSPTSRGRPSATRPRSPASSATATSRCR